MNGNFHESNDGTECVIEVTNATNLYLLGERGNTFCYVWSISTVVTWLSVLSIRYYHSFFFCIIHENEHIFVIDELIVEHHEISRRT